ncbi:hypothetical protein BX616_002157, partial [Lobosporangium transversale]
MAFRDYVPDDTRHLTADEGTEYLKSIRERDDVDDTDRKAKRAKSSTGSLSLSPIEPSYFMPECKRNYYYNF